MLGAIILEMVGYTAPRQTYPFLRRWPGYPAQGNFIGVIGNWRSLRFGRSVVRSFRENRDLPVESLFLPFDGLVSLYIISAMFGLFQGGIVPSYAIIVREYFPASEAGAKVGLCGQAPHAIGCPASVEIRKRVEQLEKDLELHKLTEKKGTY